MLKKLFHIESNQAGDNQLVLSIRTGKQHFSFVIANKNCSEIYQLTYYSIDNWNENTWQEIIGTNPSLNNSFYEVLVAFDFPESTLLPVNEYSSHDGGSLLKALYGNYDNSSIISESISGWQINNLYAVPSDFNEWMQNKFPTARFWHQYSIGLKNSNSATAEGVLQVDFRKNEFVVIVTGRSKIILSQTFHYETPEDTLYYLLRICDQFSFSRDTVELQISGLIDKQSAMYKQLYMYFININFRNATWNCGPEYPLHFFTSLNDLARCVS